MIACKIKANVSESGSVTLEALPFPAGTSVEVIVLEATPLLTPDNLYLLHNTPYHYDNPFDPIALDDWEIIR